MEWLVSSLVVSHQFFGATGDADFEHAACEQHPQQQDAQGDQEFACKFGLRKVEATFPSQQ